MLPVYKDETYLFDTKIIMSSALDVAPTIHASKHAVRTRLLLVITAVRSFLFLGLGCPTLFVQFFLRRPAIGAERVDKRANGRKL